MVVVAAGRLADWLGTVYIYIYIYPEWGIACTKDYNLDDVTKSNDHTLLLFPTGGIRYILD